MHFKYYFVINFPRQSWEGNKIDMNVPKCGKLEDYGGGDPFKLKDDDCGDLNKFICMFDCDLGESFEY